jgi:hypothetical protein
MWVDWLAFSFAVVVDATVLVVAVLSTERMSVLLTHVAINFLTWLVVPCF